MSFASTTLAAFNHSGSNSSSAIGAAIVAPELVKAGDMLLLIVGTRSTDPPVKVDDTPTVSGVTVENITKLIQYEAATESVEIWVARATADATGNVSWGGSLTGTAGRRENGTVVLTDVPAAWELASTPVTHQEPANTFTHPCGSASAVANELRLTASMLGNSSGGVTAATGFVAHAVNAAGCFQYRVETESGAKTGAWTSSNSRTSVNVQVVLREPVSGASAELTGTVTEATTEADIRAGGKTIILTLTGDTWIE